MKIYDTIIIGDGPAGITSSIYLKNANKEVLLIGSQESKLKKAKKIINYYGFEEISGEELYQKGLNQIDKLNIEYKKEEVLEIKNEEYFKVKTTLNSYYSKYLILGLGKNNINLPYTKDYIGKGVSYCVVCDGFFFRNKDVAIIGNSKYAVNEAKYLKNIVNKLYIISDKNKLDEQMIEYTTTEKIELIDKKIKKLDGTPLNSIIFEDNTTINISGLFICIGEANSTDLAKSLGIQLDNNNIIVDKNNKTNIERLYAVGDCIRLQGQISLSIGDGANAALNIIKELNEK